MVITKITGKRILKRKQMPEAKFTARLIDNGKIVNEMQFTADPKQAYSEAHETDGKPYWLTGQWIEVTPYKVQPNPKLNGNHEDRRPE